MMYEIATMRRPSQFNLDPEAINNNQNIGQSPDVAVGNDTPTTPAPSNFEIDDEFNLPISLAIFILVLYIFLGAVVYSFWEGWGFFSAFYFVFISMSTIGFGDFVPQDPICMMVSIVYLVFGLALMSMCINVVQAKLSDTFREASAKIGATIGLKVDEEDGTIATVPPATVEMPEVHDSSPKTEEPEQAKPEEQKSAEPETSLVQT